MFIASKYEEIYSPEVKDFAYVTDNTYTIKQILKCEGLILQENQFSLTIPSALSFLKHYKNEMNEERFFFA
jgi:hypothetical protein